MVQETPIDVAEAAEASPIKPIEEPAAAQEEEEVAATENGAKEAAENGHDQKAANGAAEGGAAPAEAGEPGEEELWRKRLWFVRIPRPSPIVAVKALEQELETYRAQYKLLSESFNVKKVERDAARDNTRAAREAFKASKEVYEEKRAVVQPLKDAAAGTSEGAKKLREAFGELEVRSEAELEERLQQLHYRIEHESIPLNEEKRIVQLIKKLEAQRPKVREYEEKVGMLAESRTQVKVLEGELAEHKAELQVLAGEKNMQWTIFEKFREQEQALDREVEEILAERKRFKDLMDEAYARVSELKSMQKAKNDEFYENRRFSRAIRELLTKGAEKLGEARQMCAEQVEDAHAKLSSDADYRAEYFALWEQQRKSPVSMAALDEVDEGLPAPKGTGGAKQRRQEQQPPPVDPALKAEQVIAAVLEEAKGEIMRVKAAAASAAAAAAPAPAVAEEAPIPVAAEPEPAPKPAAKPPKPRREAPRHVVELPVLPPDNFELPEAITKAKKAPSAEELKALEREHNRQAQAEAERRKQKKQQEREKKRLRALQEQQAKAKQAAEAALSAAVSEPTAAVESDAAPEQSGDESGREGAASGTEQVPAPAVVQPTAAGKAAAAPKGSKAAAAARSKAVGKRPAHAKKPLGKQLRALWKENQLLVCGALFLLVALVIAVFYATTPAKPEDPLVRA